MTSIYPANVIEPFFSGDWKLLADQLGQCESVFDAVHFLGDDMLGNKIEDVQYWNQLERVVTDRDPTMETEIFHDIVGCGFLSGLYEAVYGGGIGPAVANIDKADTLRLLMTDWDPAKVDLTDYHPWELAPDIQNVAYEALAKGVKADVFEWILHLLQEKDETYHDLAARYAHRWIHSTVVGTLPARVGVEENDRYLGENLPTLEDRLLAAYERRATSLAPVVVSGSITVIGLNLV